MEEERIKATEVVYYLVDENKKLKQELKWLHVVVAINSIAIIVIGLSGVL